MNDEHDDPIIFVDDLYATGIWIGRFIGFVCICLVAGYLYGEWV